MDETRLPSGDPLSTRTKPGEGTRGSRIEIRLFEDDEPVVMGLFDEEEPLEDGAGDELIADSDLHR